MERDPERGQRGDGKAYDAYKGYRQQDWRKRIVPGKGRVPERQPGTVQKPSLKLYQMDETLYDSLQALREAGFTEMQQNAGAEAVRHGREHAGYHGAGRTAAISKCLEPYDLRC